MTRRPSVRSPGLWLAAVLLISGALSLTVALKVPAWEAADEPGHVANVEKLVGGHWYRIPTARPGPRRPVVIGGVGVGGAGLSNELHQPPLYYLLLAGIQKLEGQPVHAVSPGPTAFPFVEGGMFRIHRSTDHRFLLWLRLPNVLLGLTTVLFTFLVARVLSNDPWTPVLAAAIVAFLPRLLFLSAFVTNDNLVDALGAALAYSSVRAVRDPTRIRFAAVGFVLGLIAITKLSALPMVLVLPVLGVTARGVRRTGLIAAALGAIAVICSWYFVQNAVRYGDPLALSASQHYLQAIGGLGTFGPYVVTEPFALVFSGVPTRIWQTFWYSSGWDQFYWPGIAGLALWLPLAFSVLGCLRRDVSADRRQLLVLATLALSGFACVWMVAFTTSSYAARLAFVGVPALACLASVGAERARLPIRIALPALELCGVVIAVWQDVLAVAWH